MGEPKTRTTAAGSPTHLQAVRQIGLTHTYLHTHTHAGSVCVCVCECVSAYGSRTQRTIAKCERCLIQVRAFLGQLLYLYRYLYLSLCLPPNTCVCVCVCTVCVFVWGSGSRPRPPPLSLRPPLCGCCGCTSLKNDILLTFRMSTGRDFGCLLDILVGYSLGSFAFEILSPHVQDSLAFTLPLGRPLWWNPFLFVLCAFKSLMSRDRRFWIQFDLVCVFMAAQLRYPLCLVACNQVHWRCSTWELNIKVRCHHKLEKNCS